MIESAEAPVSLIGRRIGTIEIRRFLAEGGMGRVYVGYDDGLQREVALKAIRPDRWSSASRSRLLSEARALSRLNHPHICAIHGYVPGEESDFLVLELIRGRTLQEILEEDTLDFRSRMAIAEEIAAALAAAHAQGVIHRDLKPANVMLTLDSGVKVLDFGIARMTSLSNEETLTGLEIVKDGGLTGLQDLAESDYTSPGKIVGTAEWMSPEQAKGEPLTVSSDMYSFGLLLQQLFTGRDPYETGMSGVDVLRRAQKGKSRPVQGLGKALTTFIERLKSMAPEDRPSAAEAVHRLRRVREAPRRRVRQLAAAAAAVLTVLGVVKYTVDLQSQRDAALHARREAEISRKQEAETTSFLMEVFKVSDPGEARGNSVTARELLDQGATKIRGNLRDQPLARARMLDTMGQVYHKLGLYTEARPLLEESLALRQEDPERPLALAESLEHLATLDQAQNRPEARVRYERALALREASQGSENPEVASLLSNLGVYYAMQGNLAKAGALFQRALAVQEKVLGPNHPDVARSLNNLAGVWIYQDHPDKAEPLLKRGLAIRQRALAPDHPDLAANLEALGTLYQNMGHPERAEPLHRRALAISEKSLGPDHPRTLLIVSNLGETLSSLGRNTAAEPLLKRAIRSRQQALGPDHPDVAYSLGILADLYRTERRFTEADPLYRRALAIFAASYNPDHPGTLRLRESYARMLKAAGRPDEARAQEGTLTLAAK